MFDINTKMSACVYNSYFRRHAPEEPTKSLRRQENEKKIVIVCYIINKTRTFDRKLLCSAKRCLWVANLLISPQKLIYENIRWKI